MASQALDRTKGKTVKVELLNELKEEDLGEGQNWMNLHHRSHQGSAHTGYNNSNPDTSKRFSTNPLIANRLSKLVKKDLACQCFKTEPITELERRDGMKLQDLEERNMDVETERQPMNDDAQMECNKGEEVFVTMSELTDVEFEVVIDDTLNDEVLVDTVGTDSCEAVTSESTSTTPATGLVNGNDDSLPDIDQQPPAYQYHLVAWDKQGAEGPACVSVVRDSWLMKGTKTCRWPSHPTAHLPSNSLQPSLHWPQVPYSTILKSSNNWRKLRMLETRLMEHCTSDADQDSESDLEEMCAPTKKPRQTTYEQRFSSSSSEQSPERIVPPSSTLTPNNPQLPRRPPAVVISLPKPQSDNCLASECCGPVNSSLNNQRPCSVRHSAPSHCHNTSELSSDCGQNYSSRSNSNCTHSRISKSFIDCDRNNNSQPSSNLADNYISQSRSSKKQNRVSGNRNSRSMSSCNAVRTNQTAHSCRQNNISESLSSFSEISPAAFSHNQNSVSGSVSSRNDILPSSSSRNQNRTSQPMLSDDSHLLSFMSACGQTRHTVPSSLSLVNSLSSLESSSSSLSHHDYASQLPAVPANVGQEMPTMASVHNYFEQLLSEMSRMSSMAQDSQTECRHLRDEMHKLQTKITGFQMVSCPPLPEGYDFPINTMEELQRLNKDLADKVMRENLEEHLYVLGGNTYKASLRICGSCLLSPALQGRYNRTGTQKCNRNKAAFSDLTNIMTVLFNAIHRRHGVDITAFNSYLSDWLSAWRDRQLGGKKNRRSRLQEEIMNNHLATSLDTRQGIVQQEMNHLVTSPITSSCESVTSVGLTPTSQDLGQEERNTHLVLLQGTSIRSQDLGQQDRNTDRVMSPEMTSASDSVMCQ